MRTVCASVFLFSVLAAHPSIASASSSVSEQVWFWNKTSSTLTRSGSGLDHGEWSYTPHGNSQCTWSSEPPLTIKPQTCVTWGSQSSGFLTGTQGHVEYTLPNNDTAHITWDNPYFTAVNTPDSDAYGWVKAWGDADPSTTHVITHDVESSDGSQHAYDYFELTGNDKSYDATVGWKRSVGLIGGSTFGPNLAPADEGGTAWAIGAYTNSDGNAFIYSATVGAYDTVSAWNEMPGAAASVAVSPEGKAWVITGSGGIYRWNGRGFDALPGCATTIGVGANDQAWITGCGAYTNGGHAIFRWTGSAWQQMPGAAGSIAVSPEGTPWVVTFQYGIYRWDGRAFQQLPGCGKSIGVGSHDAAYVIGCGYEVSKDGFGVYRWNGGDWDFVPGAGGEKVSVTPSGTPWLVDNLGGIHELLR